ncbi:MAG: hypothetical protein ACHQ0J_13910 [Candidatus Dormibacterales bacterium]
MLAYDPKLGKVVALVTPAIGDNPGVQTWAWDGRTWMQLHTSLDVLGPRYGEMAYDAAHGSLVVFGGQATCTAPGQCSVDPDTWTFDGAAWTRHSGVSTRPPARGGAAMATDPATGLVVMFGGGPSTSFSFFGDTWSWDGNAWTQLNPAVSPWARAGAIAVSDPVDKQLLLYGGGWSTQNSGSEFFDLWAWANGSWTLIQPTTTDAPPGERDAILKAALPTLSAASAARLGIPQCSGTPAPCMSIHRQPQLADNAAYVVFDLNPTQGANAQCVSYVSRDWRWGSWGLIGIICGPIGGRMPQLGAHAQVAVTGCANVRTVPEIGQVVSCLANGTPVTIDDGPVAVFGNLWWHLEGRGWMAHQLLVPG